jgi:hypothetical protein
LKAIAVSDLQARATVLSRITDAVFRELTAVGKTHSCIFGSAVLTTVLNQGGFPEAKPLTVRVEIYSPKLTAWIDAHGSPSPEMTPEEWEARGWLVIGLGDKKAEVEGDTWGGHLAVALPGFFGDRHCLCDVTVVQANRIQSGINLPPLVFRVGDEFLAGEKPYHNNITGCHVVYRAFPDDHEYNLYAHWSTIKGVDESVAKVLAALSC